MNSNNLKVLTIDDAKKWDEIVLSFEQADVYYLSGYVDSLRVHGDGEPLLFYYNHKDVRAINVVMKRKIIIDNHFINIHIKDTYYDFATPYGYGGWIIEGKKISKIFKAYKKWCKQNKIVSEFVRFHPVINNFIINKGFYKITNLGKTVTIDLTNKELIWNNFTNKNRNVIRKSENNGVIVKNGYSKELLNSFIDIYCKTMDRDNAVDYYYFDQKYYLTLFSKLLSDAQIFYAEKDGEIIASSIILKCKDKLNYHLSGSLKEYGSLGATNLLLYKASCWGSDNGCKTFHLGGGVGSSEDGLFHFKKAFYKGELTQFSIGKKIFINKIYKQLSKSRIDIKDVNFFPYYRG